MLAFFRKYEKTFLLLIFAPALLGLGITGTMTGVLGGGNNPAEEVIGNIGGEEVTRLQFQTAARLYHATNPYAQDEDAWRFLALLDAAKASGISVSDEEVGDRVMSDMKWDIAQYKAAERCRAEHIDLTTEDGKRKWQSYFFEMMTTAEFDPETYRQVVAQGDHGGLSVNEYETQAKNQELVTRYLDALRAMAVVPAGAVWKEFQEQNHRRKLALIPVTAEAYRPDPAAVGSDAPGVISDAQIKDFYERNAPDFDSPRRVRFELLAVSLEGAEQSLGAPKDEDLATYFEAHRAEIAPLTTQSYAELIADSTISDDKVRKPLLAEQARGVADRLLDQVVTKIADAEVAGQKPDLAAIGSAVRQAQGPAGALLQFQDTGVIDEAQLSDHPLLGGAAPATRWFRVATLGDVSDVLAGPKAWFVLRVMDVKPAVSPEFANIIPQVRDAYVYGSSAERRRKYEQDKNSRYLQEVRYSFETVVAQDADMQGDKPHEAGKAVLDKVLNEARDNVANRKPTWTSNDWPLNRISTLAAGDTNVSRLRYGAEQRFESLTKADIAAHPILGKLEGTITSLEQGMLNSPIETKDGKGWVCVRLTSKEPPKPKTFAEAEAQVKEDIRLQRGLERAQVAADALVTALRGLTGEALTKAIADKKLKVQETEAFARDATTLEGISDAGRLVSQAFSAEAKVDGPFDATVTDTAGNRVFVLRVSARVDAPDTTWETAAPNLRRDLLSKVRGDFATEQTRKTYLAAKGITPEHLRYAIANRDGPDGQTQLKLRQLFIAPDRKLIDGWLADKALERIHQAEAELKSGTSWDAVVSKYSEDEATRTRHGELPAVTRNELGTELGSAFAEAAFALADNATSGPIKSGRGYHLVQRQGTRGGKTVFRHLLVGTDPKALPADVRDRAWAASRQRMDEAQEKLKAGQSFAQVASTYGDIEEPNGQGQDFTVDHVTPFERAALNEIVEWDFPDGAPQAKDQLWLPDPVEVKAPDGTSRWQLFCCARSPDDRQYGTSPRHDRIVYHIESKSRSGIDAAREKLATWLKKQIEKEDDRPSFGTIESQFQKLARELTEAPDAAKGGAFGLVQLEGDVRGYGDAFLSQISITPDGKPVTAGYRTGVFRGDTGWHLVEVVEVVKATPEREGVVADLLLRSTDWKTQ
jgi:parvulin-like peptidyl-prolyl isomerase